MKISPFRLGVVFLLFISLEGCEESIEPQLTDNQLGVVGVTGVTDNSARLQANWLKLEDIGSIVEYGFVWGINSPTDPEKDSTLSYTVAVANKNDPITGTIQRLESDQKYFVRAYWKANNGQYGFGPTEAFTTLKGNGSNRVDVIVGGNELSPVSVINIGAEMAEASANWLELNPDDPIVSFGFIWSTQNDPTLGIDSSHTIMGAPSGIGNFSYIINNLKPFTDYYVRTFANTHSRPNPELGEVLPFQTTGFPPTVETGNTLSKDTDRATVAGKIITTGSSDITEYGHVWSVDNRPTINTATKSTFTGPTGDDFSYQTDITDLQNGVVYYYRTYAQNSGSINYGEVRNFKTESLPFLQISSINLIAESLEQDQKVNRGETVTYELRIQNGGSKEALGSRVEVSSNSPYITGINPRFVDLGAIAGNSSVEKVANFDVSVDPFANWDSTILLDITMTDVHGAVWTEEFSFVIESQYIVTNGLVAYYTFDRDDTMAIFSNSELNNVQFRALKSNSPNYSTDIPSHSSSGHSLKFLASQETFLNIPQNPLFGDTSRTYSFWIKTDLSDSYIFFEKSPGHPLFFFSLINNFEFNRYRRQGWGNTIFRETFGIPTSLVTDNQWHMTTLVIGNNYLKLYIDGNLADNLAYDMSGSFRTVDEGVIIGALKLSQTSTVEGAYNGFMDNIRFYNRELTNSEIQQLFNAKQ